MRTRKAARLADAQARLVDLPPCHPHRLPDEILREILAYNLLLTDFEAEPEDRVPLHADSHLLVCKRWMCIGTPLLYRDVVIRSTAQTQALADVFAKGCHAALGKYVRRLRVEGGYGMPLRRIVACAPNITDFWLSLDLEKRDSVAGITRVFSLINPTRFTAYALEFDIFENGINQEEVMFSLQKAMVDWTNMTSMTCLVSDLSASMTQSIAECPSLKELHIQNLYPEYRSSYARLLDHPGTHSNSLMAVYFNFTRDDHWLHDFEVDLAKFCPVLHAVSTITAPTRTLEATLAATSTRIDPLYSPTNVPAEIWRRIFEFCIMKCTVDLASQWNDVEAALAYNETQKMLCSVSTLFREVARPLLFSRPAFFNYKELTLFASSVEDNPVLGGYVAALQAGTSVLHDRELANEFEHPFGRDALSHVLPHVKNLTSFYNYLPITPQDLVTLCTNAAGSLQSILTRLRCGAELPTLEFLGKLERLEELELSCGCRCGDLFRPVGKRGSACAVTLPRLKTLCLNGMRREDVWDFFSHADLPALEFVDTDSGDLALARPFFATHGPKVKTMNLDELDFDVAALQLCPNLTKVTLVIPYPPDHNFFVTEKTHPSIENIAFSVPSQQMFHSLFKPTKQWQEFFSKVDLGSLPGLKTFTIERFEWPSREHAIAACKLVKGAEDMTRRWGVGLMDEYGTVWTPRVQKRR